LAKSQAGGRTTEQDEQRAEKMITTPARTVDTGEKAVLDNLVDQAWKNVEAWRSSINAVPVDGQKPPAPLDVRKEE